MEKRLLLKRLNAPAVKRKMAGNLLHRFLRKEHGKCKQEHC